MKKLKFLPSILMLALCVGVLAIGIYAVKPTENTVTGSIMVNAANPEIAIECYINDELQASYNSVRGGIDWEVGDIEYNSLTANTIYDIDDVVVMLKITNKSTKHLGAYFSSSIIEQEAVNTDILTYDELNGTNTHLSTLMSKVYLQSYSYIAPSTDTNGYNVVEMPIMFRCMSIDTTEIVSEAFSYYLNIEEYNPNITVANIVYDSTNDIGSSQASGLVKIPYEGITSLPSKAFYKNTSITHVVVPSTIKTDIQNDSYGFGNQNCFRECTNLVGISIPKSITLLPAQSFQKSTSLKSVFLPEGIIEMYHSVFQSCTSLEMVALPSTLKRIGDSNFVGATNLIKIQFNEGLETIDASAFQQSGLYQISLPSSLSFLGGQSFGAAGNLSLVDLSKCSSLKELSYLSLASCSNLKNIMLPEGLLTIGEACFQESGLTSINLPDSLLEIDYNAFRKCYGLTSVSFGENIRKISTSAFALCTGLSSFTIPKSLEKVEIGMLVGAVIENCYEYKGAKYLGNSENRYLALYDLIDTSITSLEVHPDCQYILEDSLDGSKSTLTSIKLPANLKGMDAGDLSTTIGASADTSVKFRYLDYGDGKQVLVGTCNVTASDTTLSGIKDSCNLIATSAFSDMPTTVKTVTLPSHITTISYGALWGTAITSIDLSNTAKIDSSAFLGCKSLSSVNLSSINKISDCVFSGCTSLSNVTFSDSLTQIGYQSFKGCTSLTTIELNDGLLGIDCGAFYGCTKLNNVVIPESLQYIGHAAFIGCSALKNVTINSLEIFSKTRRLNTVGCVTSYATNITVPTSIADECIYTDVYLKMDGFARTDTNGTTVYSK